MLRLKLFFQLLFRRISQEVVCLSPQTLNSLKAFNNYVYNHEKIWRCCGLNQSPNETGSAAKACKCSLTYLAIVVNFVYVNRHIFKFHARVMSTFTNELLRLTYESRF